MEHKLKNPIIPGFFPDPSICRVGDDYYIACSSFEIVPGIPIFHSKDLANWKLIGHALTQESGFHMEKNSMFGGVMAPTIRYHNGLFYVIVANFADGGNMIVTAEDPAGPWSEPHYLTDVPGIDASIFFDDDGKCYVMGTGNVWDNGTGVKERGIWLAPFDIENFCMAGEPYTIWNSGLRVATSPEAPHLYHVGEYYYLMIAEGGTERYHCAAVARSRNLFDFYEGNPANPVITHRNMGYRYPITNVGHADFVELPDGSWYAVMLGSRLIEGRAKNLGRETFICPVIWEDEWPLFSPDTGRVEWEYDAPECLPWTPVEPEPEKDEFEDEKLALSWTFWGIPYEKFYEVRDSRLILECIPQTLSDEILPLNVEAPREMDKFASFVGRRQTEPHTQFTVEMEFRPEGQEAAGIGVLRAMNHQFKLERVLDHGEQKIRLVFCRADYKIPPFIPGYESTIIQETVAEAPWAESRIVLRFTLDKEKYTAFYGSSVDDLKELAVVDGQLISTEQTGCMTGTMLGMYATGNGSRIDNRAAFLWAETIERR